MLTMIPKQMAEVKQRPTCLHLDSNADVAINRHIFQYISVTFVFLNIMNGVRAALKEIGSNPESEWQGSFNKVVLMFYT